MPAATFNFVNEIKIVQSGTYMSAEKVILTYPFEIETLLPRVCVEVGAIMSVSWPVEPFKNDMLNIEEVSKVMALSWFVLKVPEVSEAHKGSIKDSPAANVMKGA